MTSESHENRLVDETSPYLLQHAHNPVDWQPWDEQALQEAREEDKPIFLSIGYSACHWCHVMERESFEDEAIAGFLNEHFVPIKVDREERPDIDRIYMNATQMLTGQGGWPMSVFLTPDLEPFYAGTYFPPDDKWGRPGFRTILEHIAELWEEERERVEKIGDELTDRIGRISESSGAAGTLDRAPIEKALRTWDHRFDAANGGFGSSPKFPPAMQLRALLNVQADASFPDEERERALEIVEMTLARMAAGGMYDQIGGGFHRYSVDERWLVPHFEKMLYDNALLTLTYVDAYRATDRPFYRRIVEETLDYVRREMTHQDSDVGHPFYSTQDAESEGEEGKFFVWTPEMLREVLDDEQAARAEAYWDISKGGNFEHGWSIPNRLRALDEEGLEAAFDELPDEIRDIRRELFEARSERIPPGTDTKVLASWNGLMIAAFAHAGFHLGDDGYIEAAASAGSFVFEEMIEGELDGDFELMRTFKDGRARITGYLDDYAGLAYGTLALFEATGDLAWLERAERLVERTEELFWDDADGGFYFTADHHEHLIVRDKDQVDNATPSGNSLAVGNLLRLSALTGRHELRERAAEALEGFYERMNKAPQSMGEMLQSLQFHLGEPRELVILGADDPDSAPLVDVLREHFVPHAVRLLVGFDDTPRDHWETATELLEGRERIDGAPTAFVCRGGTCRKPTASADKLRGQLAE